MCETVGDCKECRDETQLILKIVLPLVLGILGIKLMNPLFDYLEKKGTKYSKSKSLFAQSFVLIVWFGITSHGIAIYMNPCKTTSQWFNGKDFNVASVFAGMCSNIVFGIIDNGGLFFGGVYLDELFALLPGSSDANVVAGYGNTYSDFLGAFLGTFFGYIIADASQIYDSPVWSQAIGITLGCLLGIAIPKAILGNKSQTEGLNKHLVRNKLLGNMGIEELKALLNKQITVFTYQCSSIFEKLDLDQSGYICIEELQAFLMEAMGQNFDQEQFEIDLKTIFNVHLDDKHDKFSYEEFQLIYKQMAIDVLSHHKKLEKEKLVELLDTEQLEQNRKENQQIQKLKSDDASEIKNFVQKSHDVSNIIKKINDVQQEDIIKQTEQNL